MATMTPQRAVRRLLASPIVTTLATPHGVDRYLELVNPLWSVDEVRARVIAVDHQTPDTVTLTLKPNGNWRGFQPGQYVRVGVEIDGVRRTRCFSPASSAHRRDGRIEITAKVNPSGEVTRYLKQHAKPGMVLTLSQPEGSFALPAERPRRMLLISGGSGITPVMSMLRTLCDEEYAGEITFLHYNYTTQVGGDLYGLFSKDHLFVEAPDYADAETYLCGPAPLMKAVAELYRAEGLTDRLHTEQFVTAPPATAPAGEVTGKLRFERTGTQAANDGRSLLEQAEAAGL